MNVFIAKGLSILSSIRFWQLVVAVIVATYGDAVVSTELAQAISAILGGSVIVGTVDKIGNK